MSSGTDILFKVSADNSTFHSLKYSPTSCGGERDRRIGRDPMRHPHP
jgi:hypothetical protein